ncbi:Coenzyme Q-binding protein COQ10 START domain-containing protein [Plasmodiophora brassicae]|nr:secrectory protein [Plasmodiophora brassicae]CEO99285.1 hypothetical protein PBRA_001191 [Plasmodiophora brassicae]
MKLLPATALVVGAGVGLAYAAGRPSRRQFVKSVTVAAPISVVCQALRDLDTYFKLCELPGEQYAVEGCTTVDKTTTFQVVHRLRFGKVIRTWASRAESDAGDGVVEFCDTFQAWSSDFKIVFRLKRAGEQRTQVDVVWAATGPQWQTLFFSRMGPKQFDIRLAGLKRHCESVATNHGNLP